MILFLTIIYAGILLLLFKFKILKPSLFWKLSPIAWSIFLLIALFVPLQFWAPSGPLLVGHHTIAIIPQVAGEVLEVHAKANVPMNKDDVLFKINPVPYQAALDDASAALALARIRVQQEEELQNRQIGRQLDLDRSRTQLAQNQARFDKVKFDLDATVVRAPADGYATNITLRPGARVAASPGLPAMAYIESGEVIVASLIMQNHLRYIETGQQAEVTFKMYPGRVFPASVDYIIPARATGYESLSGLPVIPQQITHAPFVVRLKLGEEARSLNLLSGLSGRVTIYSGEGTFAHMIRKVELRIEAILNYINPF